MIHAHAHRRARTRYAVAIAGTFKFFYAALALFTPYPRRGRRVGRDQANLWLFLAAGYSFIISEFFAWWTAAGAMFEAMIGREIPPIVDLRKTPEVVTGAGEPGVIVGQ